MNASCNVCQHPKIQAINDAIDSGRYVGVIARQFRLDSLDLDKHRAHRRPTHGQRGAYTFDAAPTQADPPMFNGQIMVTENPESQFKQAWRLAKDDDRMRARMVAWLNDQIQADEMGL